MVTAQYNASKTTSKPTAKKKVAWYNKGHLKVSKGGLLDNRYKIFKQKGKGAFSKVLECYDMLSVVSPSSSPSGSKSPRTRRHSKTSSSAYSQYTKVAIKILRLDQNRYAKEEIDILKHVRVKQATSGQDAKCIRLLRAFRFKGHYCMVFPVYPMCLKTFLDKQPNEQGLPMRFIKKITFDLLTAVAFLHRNQIVHTDIKLENVLMRNVDEGDVSLIDFGSATYEYDEHEEIITTSHYRAPEVILGIGWSYQVDLWAIGCIMFELLCGDLMYNPKNDAEHVGTIEHYLGAIPAHIGLRTKGKQKLFFDSNGKLMWPQIATKKSHVRYVESLDSIETEILLAERYNDASKEESGLFYDLLLKLLTIDPEKRITASEALRHEFLAGEKERDDLRRRQAMKNKLVKASELAPSSRVQKKMRAAQLAGRSSPSSGLVRKSISSMETAQPHSARTALTKSTHAEAAASRRHSTLVSTESGKKHPPTTAPHSGMGEAKKPRTHTQKVAGALTALRRSSEPVDVSHLNLSNISSNDSLLLSEDDKLNQLLDKNALEESQKALTGDSEEVTSHNSSMCSSSALNETRQESDLLLHRDGTVEINWESEDEDSEDEDDIESESSRQSKQTSDSSLSLALTPPTSSGTPQTKSTHISHYHTPAAANDTRRSLTSMDITSSPSEKHSTKAAATKPSLSAVSKTGKESAATRKLHSSMGLREFKSSPYAAKKSSSPSTSGPVRSKKIKNKHRKPNHRTPALTSVKKHLRTKKKKKMAVRRRIGAVGTLGASLHTKNTANSRRVTRDPHKYLKSPTGKVSKIGVRSTATTKTASSPSGVQKSTPGISSRASRIKKPLSSGKKSVAITGSPTSRLKKGATAKTATTRYRHVGARVNTGRRTYATNSARSSLTSSDSRSQSSDGGHKPQPFMIKRPKVRGKATKQAWNSGSGSRTKPRSSNSSGGISSVDISNRLGTTSGSRLRKSKQSSNTSKSGALKRSSHAGIVLKQTKSGNKALRRSSHVV